MPANTPGEPKLPCGRKSGVVLSLSPARWAAKVVIGITPKWGVHWLLRPVCLASEHHGTCCLLAQTRRRLIRYRRIPDLADPAAGPELAGRCIRRPARCP